MNNNYYQPINYERNFSVPINNMNKNISTNEYSYISLLLKSRIGKNAIIYTSFPDSIEWRDKIFNGQIIASGDDYTMIRNNKGTEHLVVNIYINYIEFN